MTEFHRAENARPAIRRRRVRWLLAGVVALGIVVRVILPHATVWLVEREGAKALGLPVTLENVDFGVLQGKVRLEGLRVAGDPGNAGDPALAWRRLAVDFEWLRLFAGELAFAEISLEGPKVALLQDAEGRVVIPIDPAADGEGEDAAPEEGGTPEAEEDAGGGWPVAIDAFELTDASVRLRSRVDQVDSLVFDLQRFGAGDLRVDGGNIGLGSIGLETPSIRYRTDRAPTGVTGPLFEAREDVAEAEAVGDSGASPAYRIAELAIEGAGISLAGTSAEPLEIDLTVFARDVARVPGHRFSAEVRLGIGGGSLTIAGRAGLAPPAFKGTVQWSGLALPLLLRPVDTPISAWLRSGSTEGDLEVVARRGATAGGEAPLARISGAVRVTDFDFAEPEGAELRVAWSGLTVKAREVVVPSGSVPLQVALESVELASPRIAWTRPSDPLNALFGEPDAAGDAADPAAPAPVEGEAPPPQVTIARIGVTDGEFAMDDRVVSPPFRDEVTGLELSIEDFRLAPRRLRNIRLSGRSLGGGPFTVTGDVEPGSMDARLRLVREGLRGYNSYATEYVHYRIGKGALSADIEVQQKGKATLAHTELTLHDLQVSPQGEDSFGKLFGVPIGVALALLRDSEGDIGLAVPVEMSESGVKTGLLPILYDAFRQAVGGALASPLKTLGLVLRGGGGEGAIGKLERDAFVPGTAVLTDDAGRRGKEIAELLAERPDLRIELRGAVGEVDRRPLAEQRLLALHREGRDWPEVEGIGFLVRRRIVSALEGREAGGEVELSEEDEGLLARLCESVEVTKQQRLALAQARAQSARAELVERNGADPAQVGVLSGVGGSESGIEIDLTVRLDDDSS